LSPLFVSHYCSMISTRIFADGMVPTTISG